MPTSPDQKRSRLLLTVIIALAVLLAAGAALLIRQGLADQTLQEQLRSLEESGR